MLTNRKKALACAISGGLAALMLAAASAAMAEGPVAQVTNLAGTLSSKRPDGTSKLLAVKSDVEEGDLLTTEENTYARIKFVDGAELVLRPGTQVKVDSYRYVAEKPESDSALISMLKGALRAVTGAIGKRNREAVLYKTPVATIGIRGTDWGALYCENDCGGYTTNQGKPPTPGLYVDVATGRIVVTNGGGAQEFSPGQFGFIGGATQPPIILPPNAGVPISTDKGTNKPPESVLGNQPNQKDFQCTIDG